MRWVAKFIAGAAVIVSLLSCDDADTLTGTGTSVPVGSITLLASNPQMGTSSTSQITITAIVKDQNNVAVEGAVVSFSATSGNLVVTEPTTDENGTATATLSPGNDRSNRTITVTSAVGTSSATLDVVATGTELSISGSSSVAYGDTVTLTLSLTDSDGTGIPYQNITMDGGGNTLATTSGSFQTDSNGQLLVQMTGTSSGTVTASALGASASLNVTVSADSFLVTLAGAEINIGQCSPVKAQWTASGVGVSGNINFSTTRGTLYSEATCTTALAGSVATDGTGSAAVYIASPNPGPFTVTAAATGGPSASASSEFISTIPASVTLQADRATIGPLESVTLTAVVRDAMGNLVKNANVTFNIVRDSTGGTITPGYDVTDSLGRAQTVYKATSATSSENGIEITATVAGVPGATVYLTVAQSSLFISFGLGNVIKQETDGAYAHPGVVFVTDAAGNAVANAEVSLSVIPNSYEKGFYTWDSINFVWVRTVTAGPCDNEDTLTGDPAYDRNGNLDTGEDFNLNGTLEPGNVASVENSITTNTYGYGEFALRYPKAYGLWVNVKLKATARVSGSESIRERDFPLSVATSDLKDSDKDPPGGQVSTFGMALSCADPN